jgi:hypothetical protein
MFCNSCGYLMQDDDRFCNRCGAEFRPFVKATLSSPPTTAGSPSISKLKIRQSLLGDATEKRYAWRIDSGALIRWLVTTFRKQGYHVTTHPETTRKEQALGKENPDSQVVEITKSGWRTALGMSESIAVRIQLFPNSTVVSLGKARWVDKAAVAAASAVVFFPVAFLPAIGYYGQRKLPSKVWSVIDEYLEHSRLQVGVSPASSAPVKVIHGLDTLNFFTGRVDEIEKFRSAIESVVNGGRASRYLAISGDSGIGKSTLLREYEKIASEKGFLVIRREFDSSLNTIGDAISFLKDAFNRESSVRLSTLERSIRKLGRELDDHGLNVGGYGFGARPRSVSPEVLQENTFQLLESRSRKLVQSGVSGIVFLLDDADRLNDIDGGWAFLKTLFQRLNEGYDSYFMLVVAGSKLFKRSGKSDSQSIRRFFDILELQLFNPDETSLFMKEIFMNNGITFSSGALQSVYELSGGHPLILQAFASELVENQEPNQDNIQKSDVKRLISGVISRLGDGFFWENFEEASTEERAVLEALGLSKEPLNVKQVDSLVRKQEIDVKNALRSLLEKGSVKLTRDGQYTLFSPLFAQYVRSNSEIGIEA